MRLKIIVYFSFLLQISLYGQNAITLLIFDQKVDLSAADAIGSKREKGQFVFEKLKMHALATQDRVRKMLVDSNVEYRCFSIANVISCRAPESMIRKFAQLQEVQAVVPDYAMKVPSDMSDISVNKIRNLEELPWGLSMIRADKVWEMGIRGQGVVVGGHDTGVAWQHPALINNYRGVDSQSIDHNYNWHDAIHSISPLNKDSIITDSTNPCGLNILEPCDDAASSHGTHTLGTVLGHDAAAGMIIGVAPQTKWIAVRNMERGYGSITSYLEGFEWFLAPTDLTGNNPDPAKAPDVINNSWACIEAEGCNPSNFGILETAVENLRRAGIFVVVSAGNSGSSGCESITTPAAIYDAAFTIGSTDQSDTISSFSSRGPVTVDGSFRIKPDVVAPGRGVLSSIRGDQYGNLSGTSMAGPHVAGVVALIISANPNLSGQVDLIEDIIRQTAVKKDDSGNCIYPDIGDSIGNFLYGAGRVDAFAAVMQALNHTTSTKRQNFSHHCRVFPNPVGEIIHIENLEPSPLNVRIYDLTGRKMISIEEFILQSDINSSHWPPGTYLVEIMDNFGNLDHRLIQVVK